MPDLERTKHRHHYATADGFSDPNSEDQYPPDLELEPTHLNIDLHLDLANEMVEGCVTTTVKARRDGPTTLTLDAVDFEGLSVVDSDGNELSWGYDGRKLDIFWVQPFTFNEQRRVAITYHVTKPVAGLYFSQPDEAYPDQPWYVTSDHETEMARHWLPCIDLPNVRATLDFYLRAESRFTILANGYLVQEQDNNDGTKTAHWKLEQLCPSYLICVAIGDFVHAADGTFEDGEQSIDVAYFSTPQHSAEDLLRTFGRTKAMLTWMTGKLEMPFPYPKYFQYALPGLSGAMENISLTSWNDWYLQDETLAQEVNWLVDQINVHEMAHSYFGDAIVCRDFAHAWLKESWATYIEQIWREDNYTQEEAQYVYFRKATEYFNEADNRYKRPIVTRRFKSSWEMYDRHLYQGGACRLHMLRCELGDEVFWAAVRDYLKRYEGEVVETDHFRHVMEEHSGRSLGKFFDQWFFTAGYPDLKITFKFDAKQKQGTFEIVQKQVDKEKGIPVFNLSTDLSWRIDGTEYRWSLTLDQPRQFVIVDMSTRPEQVRFDPDHKILYKLSFNPGDSMLRRQLIDAEDVIGRIQAAIELAATGKRANIHAIVDAYTSEPFWGVRREFARILGQANHETALNGLVGIIAQEHDPMALRDVFDAAGNYRDLRIRDAILTRLEGELPYIARQSAYLAVGLQRQDAPWKMLAEASQQPSFNGFVQTGALNGLASTRRKEATAHLLDHVVYGAIPNNARPSAVLSLADIGQGQEKATRERIVERLIDLLRDPWSKVTWAAANGLRKIQAPEAMDALEGFGRSKSDQERAIIDRYVAELRNADKTDGSAVKKQVEALQDKVRKLEEQLQKLAAKVEYQEPEG